MDFKVDNNYIRYQIPSNNSERKMEKYDLYGEQDVWWEKDYSY